VNPLSWCSGHRGALGGAVVVLSVRLVLAFCMRTPIVQPDEAAYLGTAHYLAFGAGLVWTGASYSPGLGVVLAPISRVLGDPLELYRAALLMNAALGVVAFWCCLALARRLVPKRSVGWHVATAAAAALLPALVLSGGLANASSLFVAATLLIAVLAARAWEQDRPRRWMVLGLAWGALVSVHPTAVAVGAGVVVATTFGLRPVAMIHWLRRFSALVIGAVPFVFATVVLSRRISRATPPGATGPTTTRLVHTADLVSSALGRHSVVGLFAELTGQLLYLCASTASLFLVGMLVGVRSIRSAVGQSDADSAVRLRAFATVTATATLAASVLVINPPDDSPLERLLYGRYNEHVIVLVVLVGLCAVLDDDAGIWSRSRAWMSALVVGLVATVFIAARAGKPGNVLVERQDVLGLSALFNGLQRLHHSTLAPVVAVLVVTSFAGIIVVLVIARSNTRRDALTAIGLVSALFTVFGAALLIRGSQSRAVERQLITPIADHVRRTSDGCVGYDPTLDVDWHLSTYEFMLPAVRFRPIAVDASGGVVSGQSCAEAVLAPPGDGELARLGLVPAAFENTPEQPGIVLYVLSSEADR
jgi:hypothetical protein